MTIVDPEPIANTSTSAYELLGKTPGLFLDHEGNVYLGSSTPATVYINGREQKMSAADVATLLKSLPPNSIERLELILTGSSIRPIEQMEWEIMPILSPPLFNPLRD